MTIGSFTTIPPHEDHEELFRFCHKLAGNYGDVIIGVNADNLIEESKGFIPRIPAVQRAGWLQATWADETFVNEDLFVTEDIMSRWRPNIFIVGADWISRDIQKQTGLTTQRLNDWGCVLAFAPTLNRVHSADIDGRNK